MAEIAGDWAEMMIINNRMGSKLCASPCAANSGMGV